MRAPRSLFAWAIEHTLVLPLGAIVALVWANTRPMEYITWSQPLVFAVNDVGMVFFFGLATKEVVEATLPGGALHTWRRAGLPVVAALGGMAAPAAIYIWVVTRASEQVLLPGWAVPCATDIAFSYLAAKAVFRGGHPAIPFLLLLAIADDAFGLAILALFYPAAPLNLPLGAALMAVALVLTFLIRRRGTRSFWPYILVGGSISWAALFYGGLHPALALVPIVPFVPRGARDPGLFVDAPPEARDPLSEFEHAWKYPVQAILFFFGLVNAGVMLHRYSTGSWAVVLGLVAGKPIGISLTVAAAVVLGLKLPAGLGWRDVIVTGFAAGIGFTVALFFATAAFPPGPLLDEAKLGALMSVASGLLALLAAAVLRVGRFRASPA